jgi:hypothetical protein
MANHDPQTRIMMVGGAHDGKSLYAKVAKFPGTLDLVVSGTPYATQRYRLYLYRKDMVSCYMYVAEGEHGTDALRNQACTKALERSHPDSPDPALAVTLGEQL